ncbi:MAG: single-stranded-DNA-specific exonuclease RecJ [Rhodocyclaceae bacterium]
MSAIAPRRVPERHRHALEVAGLHPLLARLYAGRGVEGPEELDYGLEALLPHARLKGIAEAAGLLADAIAHARPMLVVADYDCDGATACALAIRGLGALGARVEYLVPNRMTDGYGLTPELVRAAAGRHPQVLITVDNGIASLEGVAEARRRGIATLLTDHHLPAAELPEADAIVDPNQPGCEFPSKNLAGVGVMFYVLIALRAELRRRGAFAARAEPRLAGLLDLVALGTVADVVRLDHNNRLLVAQGLERIRRGDCQPGVRALIQVAGRDPACATSFDLGFAAGPRLNAAGRLADMSLGIECLATGDAGRALNIAAQLDLLNRERRAIETDMQDQASAMLARWQGEERVAHALFDPAWHPGVIGLLASRIKERTHRPVIAFARAEGGELRGSGRSIACFHLRDALDAIAKRRPGLLRRFGGHAAAAGVTIREADLEEFTQAFEEVATAALGPAELARRIETDGALEGGHYALPIVQMIEREVWGQGFPAPLFDDRFAVESQRLVRDRHLKLRLQQGPARFDAIFFNHTEAAPERLRAAFRLAANEYNGLTGVQLVIEHIEAEGSTL